MTINKQVLEEKLINRFEDDLSNDCFYYAQAYVRQDDEVVRVDSGNKYVEGKPIFRLASMTKPITSVAALIQEERGKLKLTDKVSRYLPDFKEMYVGEFDNNNRVIRGKKADNEMRLIDVLTHTTGVISGEVGYAQDALIPKEEKINLERLVNYYGKHLYLDFGPMERSFYSGTGAFNVLSRVIELTADMPYGDFLKEYLFDRIEMVDTTFEPTKEQIERMVPMHAHKRPIEEAMNDYSAKLVFEDAPFSLHQGGAGLLSTMDDYINFVELLYNKGTFKGKRILSDESVIRMQTGQLSQAFAGPQAREEWGLGVRVIKNDIMPRGTFGWSGAYGTHFFIDPTNRIRAIYMKNSRLDGGSEAPSARNFEKDIYL